MQKARSIKSRTHFRLAFNRAAFPSAMAATSESIALKVFLWTLRGHVYTHPNNWIIVSSASLQNIVIWIFAWWLQKDTIDRLKFYSLWWFLAKPVHWARLDWKLFCGNFFPANAFDILTSSLLNASSISASLLLKSRIISQFFFTISLAVNSNFRYF